MDTQTPPNPIPEPIQPVSQTPAKPKKSLVIILSVLLLISVAIAGFFAIQTQRLAKQLAQFQIQTTPTPAPTADETANSSRDEVLRDWKTYTATGFSFKYPSDFVVEEREKNFFVVVLEEDKNIPQAGISIDARLSGNNSDYEKSVAGIKTGLIEITINNLANGVKIGGTLGPGFGEGTKVIAAVLKYKTGAILIETTNSAPYSGIFDQILSTFRFTN